MLKKINIVLNTIISSFVGVFVGHTIFVCYDYKARPDLYAMQSSPWYTSILTYGIVAIIFIIIAGGIKLIIRAKLKKE